MEKRGFLPSDRLFQLVQQAEKDLQALFMELHYLSCSSGVGKPGAEP
jgi:hypothetical protein